MLTRCLLCHRIRGAQNKGISPLTFIFFFLFFFSSSVGITKPLYLFVSILSLQYFCFRYLLLIKVYECVLYYRVRVSMNLLVSNKNYTFQFFSCKWNESFCLECKMLMVAEFIV